MSFCWLSHKTFRHWLTASVNHYLWEYRNIYLVCTKECRSLPKILYHIFNIIVMSVIVNNFRNIQIPVYFGVAMLLQSFAYDLSFIRLCFCCCYFWCWCWLCDGECMSCHAYMRQEDREKFIKKLCYRHTVECIRRISCACFQISVLIFISLRATRS